MYRYIKGSGQSCFLCDSPATSGDHIPPKGLFTTSIRSDCTFLEVPACEYHNHSTHLDDEYFRTILATEGFFLNPYADKLYQERILPNGSPGLTKFIAQAMKPTGIISPRPHEGEIHKITLDRPRFQNVVAKIAHGLFWHHNGRRAPEGYVVTPYMRLQDMSKDGPEIVGKIPRITIGHSDIFQYQYATSDTDENTALIALNFFKNSRIVIVFLTNRVHKNGAKS